MAALADSIAAEAGLVSTFVRLLGEEQEILKNGHPDALPPLIERKTATALELAAVSASRNMILRQAGFAADRAGMESWLKANPADQAVHDQWNKLQTLAAEAKELNRVNGELIQLRMQNNSQALEVLIAAANRQDLYGADGQASQAATRRIIDSA